jgi:hypothetical protein
VVGLAPETLALEVFFGRTKETVWVKALTKLQMVIYDRKQAASGMEFYIWFFFSFGIRGIPFFPSQFAS